MCSNEELDEYFAVAESLRKKEVVIPCYFCKGCGINIYTFANTRVCNNCGLCEEGQFIPNDINTQNELRKQVFHKDGRYKRINHWKEVKAQRRGEGGSVPDDIIGEVAKRYEYYNFPLEKAHPKFTRTILNEIGYPKMKEHAVQITCKINKKPPTWLNQEEEAQLDELFLQAEQAWENCPKTTKKSKYSFPDYVDFIHRCCIYKGWAHVLGEAAGLKTLIHPKKISELNAIWLYFCSYCNWTEGEIAILPAF